MAEDEGQHLLYLGLGSNQGHRQALIRQAVRLLGERLGSVVRVSALMETEPWGFQSCHRFLNGACCVRTQLSPGECLMVTQQIERELGRTRKSVDGQYHDRTIDIDLLLYDDVTVDADLLLPDGTTQHLTLPHPHMWERDFVRIPLQEILQQEC